MVGCFLFLFCRTVEGSKAAFWRYCNNIVKIFMCWKTVVLQQGVSIPVDWYFTHPLPPANQNRFLRRQDGHFPFSGYIIFRYYFLTFPPKFEENSWDVKKVQIPPEGMSTRIFPKTFFLKTLHKNWTWNSILKIKIIF